jgi:hypothetical protein
MWSKGPQASLRALSRSQARLTSRRFRGRARQAGTLAGERFRAQRPPPSHPDRKHGLKPIAVPQNLGY